MSSKTNALSSIGHCLFCNLGCSLQIEEFAPQRWRPVAATPEAGKLCVRGQMLADLMHQPSRLYRPTDRAREQTLSQAIRLMLNRLNLSGATPGSLTVWLDANIAAEDLTAAHAFCTMYPGTSNLLVHLPPHELGAVEGLDAAGVRQTSPKTWREVDAFLIIGDPLVSHPCTAECLMRWGQQRYETPTVVIHCLAGVTGSYTSNNLVCRPGYEYWVVAALLSAAGSDGKNGWLPAQPVLQQLIRDSGVELDRVNRVATQLRSAQRPAVVVAPQSGGTDRWRALVGAAATWARQRDGIVSVLTGSPNALGISRCMRRHQIADWTSAVEHQQGDGSDVLLVVGWDPSSAYPQNRWESVVEHSGHVVLATAFPPADSTWADQIIPLALPSESNGTYLLADGQAVGVEAVMSPPAGVPTVRELFGMIAAQTAQMRTWNLAEFEKRQGAADLLKVPESCAPAAADPPNGSFPTGWPIAMISDAMQYFDGQITRHARWSQQSNLIPELYLSASDASVFGVRNGQRIRIANEQGQATVRVVILRNQPDMGGCMGEPSAAAQPTGWGGISGGFAEIRRLASWKPGSADESVHTGTIHVAIESEQSDTVSPEVSHAHS